MPSDPAFSIARSNRGIRLSLPSSEKLFAPMNFFLMNSSKISASVRRGKNAQLLFTAQGEHGSGRIPFSAGANHGPRNRRCA
jgi:hypothetical protein